MTTCPKCKAENRPEAAFCANCGTILLAQSTSTRPPQPPPDRVEPVPSQPVPVEPVNVDTDAPRPLSPEPAAAEVTPPSPLEPSSSHLVFSRRAAGTVFGGRYQYSELLAEEEHEIRYIVTEICQPPSPCVRVCSNSACQTVHVPTTDEQEKFCTVCGHPLEEQAPMLQLHEAEIDRYHNQAQVIDLQLTHPNIHPPISIFEEQLPGGTRYCLVSPYSQELYPSLEIPQVLEWGRQLASGLDYLHLHGVAFTEELDPSCFGLVGDRVVWRNFNNVRILPMLADREKINDVRLLALNLYSWITGRDTYSPTSPLNPNLNRLFQQALVGEGFTSGTHLAQQIEMVLSSGLSPFNLDYHIGHRTHPGQKREINEDSLFSITLSAIQQGISQPVGVYAIADGMGGHATGDLASSLAIQVVTQHSSTNLSTLQGFTPNERLAWLMQVLQSANQAVYDSRMKAENDMGSTLVCALLVGSQAYLAHLGDSRIYLVREGTIHQLTTDHSVVQQLVSIGKITPDEARNHPQRNIIYRSLGEKPQAEPDMITQELLPGDRLLLCSDGLSGMLDDQKMQILIHESQSPQMACDYLVDAANLAGGEDNISAILVEVISA